MSEAEDDHGASSLGRSLLSLQTQKYRRFSSFLTQGLTSGVSTARAEPACGCAILAMGVGSVPVSDLLVQDSGLGGRDPAIIRAIAAAYGVVLRHPSTADHCSLGKHPYGLALFSVFLR